MPRRSTLLAAEHRSQQAAQHLATELRADRARRALAHGFEDPLRLPAAAWAGLAEEDVGYRVRAVLGLGRLCLRALRELLVRGFAIDGLVVLAGERRALDQRRALGIRDRAELACRRHDEGALDHVGAAFFVEQRDERFAYLELGDDSAGLDLRVRAKRVGRRLHR